MGATNTNFYIQITFESPDRTKNSYSARTTPSE